MLVRLAEPHQPPSQRNAATRPYSTGNILNAARSYRG